MNGIPGFDQIPVAEVPDGYDQEYVPQRESAPPISLGGAPPERREEPLNLSAKPVNLASLWDTPVEVPVPELVSVIGGSGLWYKGRSNGLTGAGGDGKTWCALATIRDIVPEGERVLFIDREGEANETVARLKALGVTKEEVQHVYYWQPVNSLIRGKDRQMFDLFINEIAVTFVLIDSLSLEMAAAGLKENENDDFNAWYLSVLDPLVKAHITSLTIDHTGKSKEGGAVALEGRGAGSKLQRFSGALYHFKAVNGGWTKYQSGEAELRALKARGGEYKKGEVVARMKVDVEQEGAKVDITFVAPARVGSTGWAPTYLMERVSTYLEDMSSPQTQTEVEKSIGGRADKVRHALAVLVDEGYVHVETEGRKKLHKVVNRYREVGDPRSDKFVPTPAGPMGGY